MSGLGIPQTDYSIDPPVFFAGMPYRSRGNSDLITHLPAASAILPGQFVEVVSGKCRPAQAATGALKPLEGVALYKGARANSLAGFQNSNAQSTYQAGEMVPIMRKGKVYALWSAGGTTQGEDVALNYTHSSDATHEQGYFTDAATASTSGAEIDACPKGVVSVKSTGSSTVCLIELNLPAG